MCEVHALLGITLPAEFDEAGDAGHQRLQIRAVGSQRLREEYFLCVPEQAEGMYYCPAETVLSQLPPVDDPRRMGTPRDAPVPSCAAPMAVAGEDADRRLSVLHRMSARHYACLELLGHRRPQSLPVEEVAEGLCITAAHATILLEQLLNNKLVLISFR